jgi:hypothetical protein
MLLWKEPRMLFDPIFTPFIEQKPIGVVARAALQRTLDPEHLDACRSRSPDDAELLQLVIDAALRRRQNLLPARQARAAQGGREACLDEVFTQVAAGVLQL